MVSYHNLIRSDSINPVPYYYDLTRPGCVEGCSGPQPRPVTENIFWFQEEVVVSRQNEFVQVYEWGGTVSPQENVLPR